jgi:hypothetical protein
MRRCTLIAKRKNGRADAAQLNSPRQQGKFRKTILAIGSSGRLQAKRDASNVPLDSAGLA